MIRGNNIIIDTDSGADDTFCIGNMIVLHKQGRCNILGITTTCGNISASDSYQTCNVIMKDIFNMKHIPIFESPSSKILDHKCSYFYGKDGHYGKINEISNGMYNDSNIISNDFLLQRLNNVRDLTIIAIGPLTNLYLAEQKQPGILNKAKQIIIMGGAVKVPGNINQFAEYNFWMNPQAAKCVLKSNNNIVLFPLDITHKLRFSIQNILDRLKRHKNKKFYEYIISKMVDQMIKHNEISRYDKRLIIHDVLTALYYEQPDLFYIKAEKVIVNDKGGIEINPNGYKIKVAYDCKDYVKAQTMMLKIFDL